MAFRRHEDALALLRAVNNNPSVFTPDARPIVEFSIESKKAVNAREKRLQKSRENNPNFARGGKGGSASSTATSEAEAFQRKESKDVIEDKPEFMGSLNNPKQRKLPSHVGEKVRHDPTRGGKISRKDLRKQEKERKDPKLRKKRKLQREQQEAQETAAKKAKVEGEDNNNEKKKAKKDKKKKKKGKAAIAELREEKSFNEMVQKYKNKIVQGESDGLKLKKKWFD